MLIRTIFCVCAATTILALPGEAVAQAPGRPFSIVGTWGARVRLADGTERVCYYTFGPDGAVHEDDFLTTGQPAASGRGVASASGNALAIAWSAASVERADVQVIDADRFRYRITSHTGDPSQAGLVMLFHRVRTGPAPSPDIEAQARRLAEAEAALRRRIDEYAELQRRATPPIATNAMPPASVPYVPGSISGPGTAIWYTNQVKSFEHHYLP